MKNKIEEKKEKIDDLSSKLAKKEELARLSKEKIDSIEEKVNILIGRNNNVKKDKESLEDKQALESEIREEINASYSTKEESVTQNETTEASKEKEPEVKGKMWGRIKQVFGFGKKGKFKQEESKIEQTNEVIPEQVEKEETLDQIENLESENAINEPTPENTTEENVLEQEAGYEKVQIEKNYKEKEESVNPKGIKKLEESWSKKEKKTEKLAGKLINDIFDYNKKNIRGQQESDTKNIWPEYDIVTPLAYGNPNPEKATKQAEPKPETRREATLDEVIDDENPIIETEEIEAEEVETKNNETPEKINDSGVFIMPKNRTFFDKMSSKGKSILKSIYRGVDVVSGTKRVVAQMGIAYNQHWINKKEEKAVDLKSDLDSINIAMQTSEKAKINMLTIMENLKRAGNPGYEAIGLEIKKIEREEAKMTNKKDRLQSRIEMRQNKINIFTNKRDQIADKMINNYEKKLSPIEGKLEVLEEQKDRLNLYIIGRESDWEARTMEIEDLDNQKKELLENLVLLSGQSAEKASKNKTVKLLEKQIEKAKEKINKERAFIQRKQNDLNSIIAEVDKEASPYRDKRDRFVRVKNGRPIDFNLEERTREYNSHTMETASSHTRKDSEPVERLIETVGDSSTSHSVVEKSPKISELINAYNKYLLSRKAKESLQVDPNFLINSLGLNTQSRIVKIEIFKKIIRGYYKVKKIPESEYSILLDKLK